MLDLVTAYNELIGKSKKNEVGFLGDKPEVCNEIINPDSECIVKENFFGTKVVFSADENGMAEILKEIQISEENRDLLNILTEIFNKINDYFGGKNTDDMKRITEYMDSGFRSTLSQIKNKRLGQCAEKALVAHNVLKSIIHTGHIKSFDSRFISSKLNNSPHAFIIMENISQKDGNSFIFDVENPASIICPDGRTISVIGLYPISKNQLNEFYEGKSIKLKCIYDGVSGYKEDGIDRYYGNQHVLLQESSQNCITDERLD